MYFLPSPQLGVCFQKSTRGWDIKGSTFPSHLRTPPPPILVFGKQGQSKAKTCYLLSHLLRKVFPWEWQRSLNHLKRGRQQSRDVPSWVVGKGRFHFSPSPHLGSTDSWEHIQGILPFSESVNVREEVPILKKTFSAAKWKYSSSSVCGHPFRVLMLKPGPQETPPFLHKSLWFHINF